MSTATKTSSKTAGAEPTPKNGHPPTTSPAQGQKMGLLAAAPIAGLALPIQTKLAVGPPNDAYEQEADAVAEQVVTGQAGGAVSRLPANGAAQRQEQEQEQEQETAVQAHLIQRQEEEEETAVQAHPIQRQEEEEETAVQTHPIQRQEEEEETVQGFRGGVPRVPTATEAIIQNPGSGSPIPRSIRPRLEQRLGANLGHVQVHSDARAQRAAASIQARAFTHGSHIFLGPRESRGDVRLLAHESTHVVQQGAAAAFSPALLRTTPQVQRLPDFITNELASYARHIPGYTLFTVIIGFNPLTGSRVERTAVNLLQGLMGLVPFGTAIFDKLSELGIIQDAFTWVESQLATLDLSLSRLERMLEEAKSEMDFLRLDPFEYNVGVLSRKFGSLLNDVTTFAGNLVTAIIQLIKEAAIGVAEGLLANNAAWALIKKILKTDPLRGEPVEATTEDILADFLLLIGKEQELAQMRERGTLAETAVWLDTQFAVFMGLLSQFRTLMTAAWDAIQPANLPNLMTNLQTLAGQVVGLLQGVWDFATTVAAKVLELIKNALLGWLKTFATDIPGYHLLTVILGKDVFTQEEVPPTPTNLIRGFMSLMPGGERQFQQMQETGVIPQAAQRIEALLSQLGISWPFVQELFLGIWNALTIEDLIAPLAAFARITAQFGEPISRLFAFVVEVVKIVLELILQIMNFPLDIIQRIIANAMQAFEDIQRDPVGFLKNMLAAVKLGFSNFFDNILQHLLSGVTEWLFGQLRDAGIEPPAEITLSSILDLVLQILGISIDRIWEKLGERIGPENVARIRGAIDRLVGIWNFVRDVQERGVAAIWEYIQGQISNLWDMVMEQARNWIVTRIIEQVTVKLLSMLDPTGIMAVVNSFIAFFKAVQSAIEYFRAMLLIVDDYVSTIAAVARGELQPGAARLEQALANAIPVAIGFLANQVGLGRLADKIAEIIASIREVIDRALDWLLDQAIRLGQSVLNMLGMGGGEEGETPAEAPAGCSPAGTITVEKPFTMQGQPHTLSATILPNGSVSIKMASVVPQPLIIALENSVEEVRGLGDSAPEGLLGVLERILSAARQDENEMHQNYLASDARASIMQPGERTLAFETYVDRELTQLMLQLIGLAEHHNLRDLKNYFAAVPEKRYLPSKYDVRARLYEGPNSGWDGIRVRLTREGKNDIRSQVINAQKSNDIASFNALKREDKFIPSSADIVTFDPDWIINGAIKYHLDHKISLAEHWQHRSGNLVGDSERWSHTTSENNLELVTKVFNERKSSSVGGGDDIARFQPRWVGLTFTSHLAESNRDKAKRIDGQPFQHAETGPDIQ